MPEETVIDISGLDKAAVLAALYNRAKAQGLGILHYNPEPMDVEEAREILAASPGKYFDYVKGRVMKVSLAADTLDSVLYDRDNGRGAMREVIEELRDYGVPTK